jgi:hypothetical protein
VAGCCVDDDERLDSATCFEFLTGWLSSHQLLKEGFAPRSWVGLQIAVRLFAPAVSRCSFNSCPFRSTPTKVIGS